jgi:hypothetical protein
MKMMKGSRSRSAKRAPAAKSTGRRASTKTNRLSENGIKIESGIPMPDAAGGRKARLAVWPFAELKVGESFVFLADQRRAASNAAAAAKRNKHKYTTRKLPDGNTRIWRVS